MSIRLAICCSNRIYAEGLKSLLEDESGIIIVGICDGSSISGLEDVLKLKPDVVLADFSNDFNMFLNLPDINSKDNKLRILIIGDRSLRLVADKHLKESITKGVVGILPPSSDSDLLKKALKAVSLGELWLDRTTLIKILVSMRQQEKNVALGRREREIMFHICQGFRNKEIAQKLNISEQTVKSHCNRLYKKLGVSDRLQLALYSYKLLPHLSKE
jgi:two-component system, NarL family, response regulator DegU